MTEELTICPYTGLRSFSEEEALYFKGRETQIDQMTVLVEKNKFLMVTGASGEGKSSLIFAGLIPNARAGFFKARYNNWVVADFRPERTPVKNMAVAVSKITGSQVSTSETELRRGFSSLVDLYKNSELYIDEQDEKWRHLPEPDKKSRKRSAANLLVLVDQFEEFFTNPENFHNGAPTPDSQIVVNLLLETAKIALNENLPIYVVCTMRSDYIGQCSAFRGLPEYIGFSQFFVPRLKRKEIKQVIEEPALLSGNRISQRLVERLVYDLAEGIDQLPILQHALSQIWLVADHGREEMDLIHYAMVGGMPSRDLPEQDQQRFASWFQTLPEYDIKYYLETGLNRVIELHANRLYESAWEYYNASYAGEPVSQKDAKNIIALTFACLTKIDNSRAVRNRMTLRELTQIIHRPELTTVVVGGVLNVFREESNSFIRPFKTGDRDSRVLSPDSVLDITHESLIRNWGRLNKWATQEYEFYTTFLDFKKQLDRWTENKKSKDYLLPIGPLSFFESWYARCKPNAYWINRYVGMGDHSLNESERVLRDTQEFLRKSARKVIITRTFMKYGANRIAAVTTILLMVIFSGFYWYDADQKKNSRVIDQIRKTGQHLLNSKEVGISEKADFLITEERYQQGKLLDYLHHLEEGRARLNLAIEAYKELMMISKHMVQPVKADLIQLIHQDINKFPKGKGDIGFLLEKYNLFIALLAYDNYYNPNPQIQNLLSENGASLFNMLLASYSDKSYYQSGITSELNLAVHNWLTFGQPRQKQIKEILSTISPLESPQAQLHFDVYYPKGNYELIYDLQLDYSGGYHTLASLYAAAGELNRLLTCFEKLNEDPSYFTGAYTFNNYGNPLGYFYQYGHRQNIEPAVRWITAHANITGVDVYSGLLDQTGFLKFFYGTNIVRNLNRSFRGNFYPNLNFLDEEKVSQIESDLEKSILKIKNPAERSFKLALHFKQIAVYAYKYHYDQGLPQDQHTLQAWLDKSWHNFESVSNDYLNTKVSIPYRYFTDGRRKIELSRRQLYLYPDHLGGWLNSTYLSDLFFNFVSRKAVTKLYTSTEDLKLIHYWVANHFEYFPASENPTFRNDYPLADSTLQHVLGIVDAHPHRNDFDANLINMVLANRAFERGEDQTGLKYFKAVKQENMYATANTYEYVNKTFVYNQLKDLSVNLAKSGQKNESMSLSEKFEKPYQVIFSYLFSADELYDKNYDPQTFVLLDSALTKMDKVELSDLSLPEDFRYKLLYIFGKMGGDEIEADAKTILRNMDEGSKWVGSLAFAWGLASTGNYYKASVAIPSSFTETQDLICRTLILNEACEEKERNAGVSAWKELTEYYRADLDYVNYEPF